MATCVQCGGRLAGDDIGLYRKLIDRQARECLCRLCLATRLRCDPAILEAKIRQFREQGCVLFPEP